MKFETTMNSRFGRAFACGALALLSTAVSASAAIITQTVNGGFGTNWNGSFWGSPAAVPTAANDYVTAAGFFSSASTGLGVNVTGVIRDNGTTFAGNSITVSSNTELLLKHHTGSTSTANVILNGGVLRLAPDDGGTATLAGTLDVASSSVLGVSRQANTSLTITSTVTGAANMRLAAANQSTTSINTLSMTFNGNLSGYTGVIDVGGGNRALTLNLAQAYNLPDLMLTYGNHTSADILNLTHHIAIGAFSFGATSLDPGTYTASELNNLFGNGSQFTGASTLTVIPEPGAALLGGLGLLALLRRRR